MILYYMLGSSPIFPIIIDPYPYYYPAVAPNSSMVWQPSSGSSPPAAVAPRAPAPRGPHDRRPMLRWSSGVKIYGGDLVDGCGWWNWRG